MCRADACKCNSKWFEVWICVTTSIRIVNLQTQRQNMLGPHVTGEMMRDAWACHGGCKQLLKGFGGKRLPWWKAGKRNLQSAGTDTESEYVSYIRYICIMCFLCLSLSLSDETLLFKRIRETWELRFAGCEPVRSVFALQVFHQPTSQWFEIHDLRVPNLQEKILLPSYKRMRR